MTGRSKKTAQDLHISKQKKTDPILTFLVIGTAISWIAHTLAYQKVNGCAGYNGSQSLFVLACLSTGILVGYLAGKSIHNHGASKKKEPVDVDLPLLGAIVGFVLVSGLVSFLLYLFVGFSLYFCF